MTSQRMLIDQFLQCKRIAIVGVSRNPKNFSRSLWDEFRRRGYDLVPVHPIQDEVDGIQCHRNIRDIAPAVEAALILTAKSEVPEILSDCGAAGVGIAWVYGIRGPRSIDAEIISSAIDENISLIAGYCPFMFLAGTPWFHQVHKFGSKLIGYYPN